MGWFSKPDSDQGYEDHRHTEPWTVRVRTSTGTDEIVVWKNTASNAKTSCKRDGLDVVSVTRGDGR